MTKSIQKLKIQYMNVKMYTNDKKYAKMKKYSM